jgi:hypothetical protein
MMLMKEGKFGGSGLRDPGLALYCAPFLIDTAAIRSAANLLKIKRRDQF